jgi:alanine racemase
VIGDEVVLWGPEHPVEHFAQMIDTINYECVTRVSSRVPRKTVE